jgi:hypothetical protein
VIWANASKSTAPPLVAEGVNRSRKHIRRYDGFDHELQRFAFVVEKNRVSGPGFYFFNKVFVDRDLVATERDRVAGCVLQPTQSLGILRAEADDARGRVIQHRSLVLHG